MSQNMQDMSEKDLQDYVRMIEPMLAAMLPQLLIIACNERNGEWRVPVKTVDNCGRFIMTMEIDQVKQEFVFKTKKKQ